MNVVLPWWLGVVRVRRHRLVGAPRSLGAHPLVARLLEPLRAFRIETHVLYRAVFDVFPVRGVLHQRRRVELVAAPLERLPRFCRLGGAPRSRLAHVRVARRLCAPGPVSVHGCVPRPVALNVSHVSIVFFEGRLIEVVVVAPLVRLTGRGRLALARALEVHAHLQDVLEARHGRPRSTAFSWTRKRWFYFFHSFHSIGPPARPVGHAR